MAKKAKGVASEWGERLTPGGLARYGALDVAAPWRGPEVTRGDLAAWQIWLLKRSARDVDLRGFISLAKTPIDGGEFDLAVRQELNQASQKAVHVTEASIRCESDRLSSPRSWKVLTRLARVGNGDDFAGVSLRARGTLRDGCLEVSRGGRTSARPIGGPVTSSWSLLDALGRIGEVGGDVIRFTLLDELDKIKTGQRLRFRETTTIRFAGESRRVNCFEHVGRGALPWVYYVDGTCGLLLATSGLRAYIRDAEAPKRHAAIVGNSVAGDRERKRAGGAQ
ncbi:MAG: hypothetical protein ACYTKD_27610 [Planctomycetota bacterium]|jgi:hypothetical protein